MTLSNRLSLRGFISGGSSLSHMLVLIVVAAFVFLWRLGAGSLEPWDEAIYAQVSKEIVYGGDWLTLHWQYQPWFEKPPLLLWTTAALYRLFGVNEFWARAASAFSGIGLIAVTYLIGQRVYDKWVGLFAAVILLTSYHVVSFARFGTMDLMLTLFTYLAIYAYLRLKDGGLKWWYLIWFSCALAVMVKGAGGLIAPAAIMLSSVLDGRFTAAIRSRHFWQGGLLAFVIVAPWHILMYVWHGRAFIDEYISYHVIARLATPLEGHPSSYFYYVGKLIDGFFPWFLLVPFAVASSTRKDLKGHSRSRIFLLLSALVFGFYTMIPTRRPWYIVPLYPALAIIIAYFARRIYQTYQARRFYRRAIISAGLLLVIAGGMYSALSLYLNHNLEAPLAKLARLAESKSFDDRDYIILFSESEPLYAQTPLFYSNRPVRQAYAVVKPTGEDAKRYVNYEKLADLTAYSMKRIILPKDAIERLALDYDIHVLAEAGPMVYAMLKRKS